MWSWDDVRAKFTVIVHVYHQGYRQATNPTMRLPDARGSSPLAANEVHNGRPLRTTRLAEFCCLLTHGTDYGAAKRNITVVTRMIRWQWPLHLLPLLRTLGCCAPSPHYN